MRDIYFLRHASDWRFDDGKSVRDYLFEHKLIAIDFGGGMSWDPQDYGSNSARTAISYMNRLNKVGSEDNSPYIFATYPANSEMRILLAQVEGDSAEFLANILPELAASSSIKTLKLRNAKQVLPKEFPRVHLLAPKYQTFVRWNQCRVAANHFINGTEADPLEPESFLPRQLEMLCEEFLRLNRGLRACLFQTGGELKDFDVIGSSGGCRRSVIYAQVKMHSTAAELDAFKAHARAQPDDRFYFFQEKQTKIGDLPNNVEVLVLGDVLRSLKDCQALGADYLQAVLRS